MAKSHFKNEKASIMLVYLPIGKRASKKVSKRKMLNPKCGISRKKKMVKNVSAKGIYFHYSKNGHWKRNCKIYLAGLKQQKDAKVGSDLYII